MRNISARAIFRSLLLAASVLPLSGCLTVDEFGSYGAVSSYGYDEPAYIDRSSSYYRPYAYSNYRPYSSSWGAWGGSSWCDVCHSRSCRGHQAARRSDRDNCSYEMKKQAKPTYVRLVDYNEHKKRSVPDGYHTKEWFKERGYSLKDNTYKTKDGDYRGKVPSKHKKD